ncbi:hypothetical protein ABMA32_03640 [Mesorhizobium sp. VNQ89]|uniref:hypothetical protein n=1 Tax=Mesorhizobium quangtriensis TaxID=3157709 RepID=UPI0032B71C31
MVDNSIALRVETPDIANSFIRGQESAQRQQMNSLNMAATRQNMATQQREQGREEALELMNLLGSIGLGAMGGKIDGQADPKMWEEGLDYLDQSGLGVDTKPYRGKPELARLLVDSSISATDRIRQAREDREFQLSLERFDKELTTAAANLDINRQRLDLQRDRTRIAQDKADQPPKLSATELKAVHEAEDSLPGIDSSISQLERALELNETAFSGFGAGMRGAVGAKTADWMTPDWVADKAGSEATSEYQAIMTGEAATAMSAALKGATTDKELGIFMDIIGDVSKPPKVRKQAIDRLLELAKAHRAKATKRIEELRNVAPAQQQGSGSGIEPGTEQDGYRYTGGDPADEASWEMLE